MSGRDRDWVADPGKQTAVDLGEQGVIALATAAITPDPRVMIGPGDDAAVITAPDRRVVVSSDALVEGQHFRFDYSTAAHVGRRAIAQNAADIAAMGAVPTGFTVTLGCPPTTTAELIAGLSQGVAAGAELSGGTVVGGDVVRTSEVVLAVTALGDLQGRQPVPLSGARPGDVVALAGTLGYSAAGLAALAAGRADQFPDLVEIYRVPQPPLAAGPAAADAGATAMTDISDGLLKDAGTLARASGVQIDLHGHELSPTDELQSCARVLGTSAIDWILTGGEDHALLATLPADVPLPVGWRVIGLVGSFDPALGEQRVTVDGQVLPDGLGTGGGWNTFAPT